VRLDLVGLVARLLADAGQLHSDGEVDLHEPVEPFTCWSCSR
jgi:hypothetical protein